MGTEGSGDNDDDGAVDGDGGDGSDNDCDDNGCDGECFFSPSDLRFDPFVCASLSWPCASVPTATGASAFLDPTNMR